MADPTPPVVGNTLQLFRLKADDTFEGPLAAVCTLVHVDTTVDLVWWSKTGVWVVAKVVPIGPQTPHATYAQLPT